MAKDNYEARMQGMLYACSYAEKHGVDALKADIRKRGLTRLPVSIPTKEMDRLILYIKQNLMDNLLYTVAWVMHSDYGFGKKRLQEFMDRMHKAIGITFDFDYMGEHYVRLEDYAIELKEKFGFDVDINSIAANTDAFDEKNPGYRMCKVDRVLEELRRVGYNDAADFLERKMDR